MFCCVDEVQSPFGIKSRPPAGGGGGLAPSNHSPHCTQFNLLLRERNSTSCCLHGHTPPYGHSISLELDEQPLELSSDEKESEAFKLLGKADEMLLVRSA